MLSVETKGIYRDRADLLDLRVLVFERRDSSLRPQDLESASVVLMRGPASTKQVLQRIEFDARAANSDGTFRAFFLHPNSLENLFYQIDVRLAGGFDYTKIGTFAKVAKPKDLLNDQPDLGLPPKPENVGAIGDPLAPLANVDLAPPIVLPQFFDLVDGAYVIKPGYKRQADVFVRERGVWQRRTEVEVLPPPIIRIAPVSSGSRTFDLITLVKTVAPSATIPPYGIVSISEDGLAVPASSTSSLSGTIGVNIADCEFRGGQMVRTLLVGKTKVYNGGTPLQPGKAAWVSSTPGAATTTQPLSNALKLGVAITADEIAISVSDLH